MHVVLVIFGDLDLPSGGYLYDQYLVAALRDAGHTVSTVSQPAGLSYREQCRLGARGRRVSIVSRDESAAAGRGIGKEAAAAIHRIADLHPDVLVIDELNHAATEPWLDRLRTVLPDLHITGLVHHLRSDEGGPARWTRRRERRFLRRCDSWLCNSTVTLRRAAAVSRVRRSSAVAFPAGDAAGYGGAEGARDHDVQGERRSASASSEAAPLHVLTVGSVIPRKNIDVLVRAVARSAHVELSIVGDLHVDLRYTERIRELVQRLGVDDRVHLRGRVPVDILEREFARADLLAAPSRYEGFGIVYLEAYARGVPVIASGAGGAREIVRPGKDGFLVGPGSVRAVERVFSELAADRSRLESLSAQARLRSRQFHPWERTMAGAVRFLEEMGRRAPSGEDYLRRNTKS